jgi:ParB-like chromosome segregation protein Spo0J
MKKLPTIDGIIIHCAHSEIVPIEKLVPFPRNNKKHPEAQIALLAKAIKAQGFRAPITVSNQSGYIVRGHARLEAAKRLGLKSVPVDRQNYASTQAERADRLADNRIAELAETDLDALKSELLELDDGSLDMDLTGFDTAEIERLMTQIHPDEPTPEGSTLKCPKCGHEFTA